MHVLEILETLSSILIQERNKLSFKHQWKKIDGERKREVAVQLEKGRRRSYFFLYCIYIQETKCIKWLPHVMIIFNLAFSVS